MQELRVENLVRPGDKFALLACSGLVDSKDLPFKISDRMTVLGGTIQPNDWWKEALGTFTVNRLRDSNYSILAHAPSERPEVLDGETMALEEDVLFFRMALSLAGVFQKDEPQLIRGYCDEEGLKPKQHCYCGMQYPGAGLEHVPVSSKSLSRAKAANSGIRSIKGVGDKRHLAYGMEIFLKGLTEPSCDERILHFVRAIECSHATTKSDRCDDFVSKCNRISTDSYPKELFEHAYKIRNNVVHMNPFEEIWFGQPDAQSAEKYICECADALELFTRDLYRQIFSSQKLIETFSDRRSAKAFWLEPKDLLLDRELFNGYWVSKVDPSRREGGE